MAEKNGAGGPGGEGLKKRLYRLCVFWGFRMLLHAWYLKYLSVKEFERIGTLANT